MTDYQIAPELRPAHPGLLEDFRVEIMDQWETSQGVGFTGVVSNSDNTVEFGFENDGNGGCNMYHAFYPESELLLTTFKERSRTCYPTMPEPEDIAVLWLEIRENQI